MMPPFVVFPTNRIAHFVEVSLYLFYLAQRVKLIWGTDSTAVLLLGILWLLQIIAARIYSRKEKKRNGKERERV